MVRLGDGEERLRLGTCPTLHALCLITNAVGRPATASGMTCSVMSGVRAILSLQKGTLTCPPLAAYSGTALVSTLLASLGQRKRVRRHIHRSLQPHTLRLRVSRPCRRR